MALSLDSIDHKILLRKLPSYGVDHKAPRCPGLTLILVIANKSAYS